jgi:Uma2 family endonuclease
MAIAASPKRQTRRLWTFDQMAAELTESNSPTELWDGKIIMSPAPTPSHQDVVLNFATLLKGFVRSKGLGRVFVSPIDLVLSERRAVQPDVTYISKGRLAIIQDAIRGVPDLVAEVISGGTWKRDRVEKKGLYEQFGIAEYWIIDPEAHTIEVFVLGRKGYELHSRAGLGETAASKLLSGFSASWDQLID